ncbi:hypothetical protein OAH77_04455 [Flavobacteriaceae bacterium]|nr:hypothetical protein [Flavobacteriaceae bacterium]
MQIKLSTGEVKNVTHLYEAIEQANAYGGWKHEDPSMKELDKKLQAHWTEIYDKLVAIKDSYKRVGDVKKGEYIQVINKKGLPQKKVYERSEYNSSERKYTLTNFEDINDHRYVKGDTLCIIADI